MPPVWVTGCAVVLALLGLIGYLTHRSDTLPSPALTPETALSAVRKDGLPKAPVELAPSTRNDGPKDTGAKAAHERRAGHSNDPTPPPKTSAGGGGTTTGPVTIQPGGVASFGQQGGITAAQVQINPLPLERTWQIPIAKCDEWVKKLDALGPTNISVGAFISNNDGNRVVRHLAACFNRSTWTAQMALLPVNPEGVEIGAAEAGPKLDAVETGLFFLGLRVTKRDIRPEYRDKLGIVIGTDPIKQQP
jgi:hypothetical protein